MQKNSILEELYLCLFCKTFALHHGAVQFRVCIGQLKVKG